VRELASAAALTFRLARSLVHQEVLSPLPQGENRLSDFPPVAGPLNEKLIKRSDGRLFQAPDQIAKSLPPRSRPACHCQT
jgi:hypothetical protein